MKMTARVWFRVTSECRKSVRKRKQRIGRWRCIRCEEKVKRDTVVDKQTNKQMKTTTKNENEKEKEKERRRKEERDWCSENNDGRQRKLEGWRSVHGWISEDLMREERW